MLGQPLARTFISYSRKDGAKFAADLRKRLLKEDFSVWQDIIALEGGQDWWSQIEDALKSKALSHFVLIVTPGALASPMVRREIRLARQEGKTVCPVKGPGLTDLGKVPRWLGQIYDLDLKEHFTTLIRILQGPSTQKRVAMMAPEPPHDFVQRPAEFDALKRQLLDAKGDAIAITAALRGAGGYGKTTLAQALGHDPDIQDAYFDGILWVELGEKPGNLLSIVSDLIEILSGERPGLQNINAAAAKLGEALGDRRILMVVDDAWREQDLRPFLRGGPNTTRLITTRRDNILPNDTVRQPVDAMQGREALALLAAGLPEEQVAAQRLQFGKLAARLGEWALLLTLVNGFLRDRVTRGQKLAQAITGVNQRLDGKGLSAFDARNEADRTKAVARTIGVSLGLLDDAKRARFGEFAVFPEDADIPIGIVARLWAETGGIDAVETEDLLSELHGLSLLLRFDLDQRVVRLHDTVRQFLYDQAGPGLLGQHKRLLRALDAIGASSNDDASTQHYYYLWLPHHLAEVADRRRLDALLLDPSWLKAKLAATKNPHTLVTDYEQYASGETQNFIGRTLSLTAGICARDPRQLIPQLLCRLMCCQGWAMKAFLDRARGQIVRPVMLTERLSLTPPGAETVRLEGPAAINSLCVLPDGRLASGPHWLSPGAPTIQLWDVATGSESARLEGGSIGVRALCVLPDGQLASGCDDGTIRLWDTTNATETARLQGHSEPVEALCVLPDGRLASGAWDDRIRLWDVITGAAPICLKADSRGVTALCALPDGRLASGSWRGGIRLWDVITGAAPICLEPDSCVTALCVLPDGRLASGSKDGGMRLWDVITGAAPICLEGHSVGVNALCGLPDGRLASGSEEGTVRLWDTKNATETACLEGHSKSVEALRVLPDGRLASGSSDRTIRLWDVNAETPRLEGHSRSVTGLSVLPDGRLASGSSDDTIRLWNVMTDSETARLEGRSQGVTTLCVLPDGRLASGSKDSTLRLWDVTSGAQIARLEVPGRRISALCALPDGRLASGSTDRMIRLWDTLTGTQTARLEGHSHDVETLCVLPDGRLASGCWFDRGIRLWNLTTGAAPICLAEDSQGVIALCVLPDGRLASGSGTIQLWDVKTGAVTTRLQGHSGLVGALCVLPDGRLASGSRDHTIRLWDITTAREIARLEVDASVTCLAALPGGRLVAGDEIGRLHWLNTED
jgi:WD40 repeat protein